MFKPTFREDGGGIEYRFGKNDSQAFVVYNDPNGMLIKVRREGNASNSIPVALQSPFTTFERAGSEVERYLYSTLTATKKKLLLEGE